MKYCECGHCDELIPERNKNGPIRFKAGHRPHKVWDKTATKLCQCGCGKIITKYNKDGIEQFWAVAHNLRSINHGETHPSFKGGRIRKPSGYIMVRCDGHPRALKEGQYVFEHVIVMEKHLGRYLTDNEVVHHKNHKRDDNRIENLQLMTKKEHSKLHGEERRDPLTGKFI